MHLHGGAEHFLFTNGGTIDFLAKLVHERERLDRLAHLIARKRNALKEACTRLRLGVSPDAVAVDIVAVCRQELADLDLYNGSGS